MKTEV